MSNPTEFFLPQTPSKAAAFGVAVKRWFRTSHNLKVRAHIGSSTSGGTLKDPSLQWVSVRVERDSQDTFPQSLVTAALDVVYPTRTSGDQGMGNISRTSIALAGREWVEVEKLLASRAEVAPEPATP